MKAKSIKISKFHNQNGNVAWRVSGTINGERIRRNFRTRAEAVSEKQILEIKRKNAAKDLKTIATQLTPEQVREAEHTFRMIEGRKQSLTFAVQYLLENYREAETENTLSDTIREYLGVRSRDAEKGIISARHYQSIKKELNRFGLAFPETLLGEITTPDIAGFLDDRITTLKTWNNRRGYLNTFFRFCEERDWRSGNPIKKLPHQRIRRQRGTAETLTAKESETLMHFAETYDGLTDSQRRAGKKGTLGVMANFVALCLFAGIRPDYRDGEISKLREEDIDLETGVIRIEPEVSKINEKRTVQIQPNLDKWFRRYPLTEYPIVPANVKRMYRVVRDSVGAGHDVLRHTYISMLVGKFRSVGEASLQAGNSEAVIRRYYLDVKPIGEADKFWNVRPMIEDKKVV